jgi:hypothetical protein
MRQGCTNGKEQNQETDGRQDRAGKREAHHRQTSLLSVILV